MIDHKLKRMSSWTNRELEITPVAKCRASWCKTSSGPFCTSSWTLSILPEAKFDENKFQPYGMGTFG